MKLLNLHLKRHTFTETETLGNLLANGKLFCYTLEDKVRKAGEAKVYGETAIPAGRYEVVVDMSNRFKRLMPRLLKVPNFEGVRLHGGNFAKDSHGCPLVAYNQFKNKPHPVHTKIRNWIQGSAEKDLTKLIQSYDKCFITID